jgi:hypothetical protein
MAVVPDISDVSRSYAFSAMYMATALWNFMLSQPASPNTTGSCSFAHELRTTANIAHNNSIDKIFFFIVPPYLIGADRRRPAQYHLPNMVSSPPGQYFYDREI